MHTLLNLENLKITFKKVLMLILTNYCRKVAKKKSVKSGLIQKRLNMLPASIHPGHLRSVLHHHLPGDAKISQ